MIKKLFISAVILLAPLAVFASTDITHLTLDGKTNVSVDEGDSVNAKVTYNITSDDDVESLSWELVGSGLPKVCVDISDRLVSGTFNTNFDIDTIGSSQGTWDVKIVLYGTNGEGANQNCEGSGNDYQTFADRITVDNDNSTGNTSGNGNNDSAPSWLSALIAQMQAQAAAAQAQMMALIAALKPVTPSTPPTGGAGSLCSQIPYDTFSLQGFLMSHGQAGPFNAIGVYSPTGFRGQATETALQNFRMQNNCNAW